jgi:hypothetical protein
VLVHAFYRLKRSGWLPITDAAVDWLGHSLAIFESIPSLPTRAPTVDVSLLIVTCTVLRGRNRALILRFCR